MSLVSAVSVAQIQTGLKAALNLNHTKFQEIPTYHPGFAAGAFCRYEITDFLFLNAEIDYSQTGGGYDSGYYYVKPEVFRKNVNLTFHSVAVPLFASATLPAFSGSAVAPLVLAGVEYAYSLKAVESYDNVYRYRGEEFVAGVASRNAAEDFGAHQPAMLFGAGASLTIHGMRTIIDIRYISAFKKYDFPNGRSGRFKTLSMNIAVSLFDFQ